MCSQPHISSHPVLPARSLSLAIPDPVLHVYVCSILPGVADGATWAHLLRAPGAEELRAEVEREVQAPLDTWASSHTTTSGSSSTTSSDAQVQSSQGNGTAHATSGSSSRTGGSSSSDAPASTSGSNGSHKWPVLMSEDGGKEVALLQVSRAISAGACFLCPMPALASPGLLVAGDSGTSPHACSMDEMMWQCIVDASRVSVQTALRHSLM
jgi:hypothetical protein